MIFSAIGSFIAHLLGNIFHFVWIALCLCWGAGHILQILDLVHHRIAERHPPTEEEKAAREEAQARAAIAKAASQRARQASRHPIPQPFWRGKPFESRSHRA